MKEQSTTAARKSGGGRIWNTPNMVRVGLVPCVVTVPQSVHMGL